jgi:hypothetical protein
MFTLNRYRVKNATTLIIETGSTCVSTHCFPVAHAQMYATLMHASFSDPSDMVRVGLQEKLS